MVGLQPLKAWKVNFLLEIGINICHVLKSIAPVTKDLFQV
jgi:hypothetical protein